MANESRQDTGLDLNAGAPQVLVFLAIFGVLLVALLVSNGLVRTPEEAAALLATYGPTATYTPTEHVPVPTATPVPAEPATIAPTHEPLVAAEALGFTPPTPAPLIAAALLGFGSSATETPAALPASEGEAAYVWNCSTCHGADGAGAPPYGPSLLESPLLDEANRADLITFLTDEHPPINPEDEFPHPIRGGYPELTDAQVEVLVDYLYGLAAGE